jgi:hypothetical protein
MASATSEPISRLRTLRLRQPAVEPRSASRSAVVRSGRDSLIAGARPKRIAVATESPIANESTVPSNAIDWARGMLDAPSCLNTEIAQTASAPPPTPPAVASSRLSVRN